MDLAGKTAVVTGGNRGIGAAIARELAERGASVVVAARSEAAAHAVAAQLTATGQRAFAATVDVSSQQSVQQLAARAAQLVGSVDILVNNAGVASSASVRAQTLEAWNHVLAVNATGTFLATQAFLPSMVERRFGRIINIASVTSRTGAPYIAAYTASKHAVLGFTRSVAAEVAGSGVTVNCVCPGYVDTDMTAHAVADVVARSRLEPPAALAAILGTLRQPRLITPEEVAHVVAGLASPRASAVTAQAIVVDAGGLIA